MILGQARVLKEVRGTPRECRGAGEILLEAGGGHTGRYCRGGATVLTEAVGLPVGRRRGLCWYPFSTGASTSRGMSQRQETGSVLGFFLRSLVCSGRNKEDGSICFRTVKAWACS